jgi:hypothetical protein
VSAYARGDRDTLHGDYFDVSTVIGVGLLSPIAQQSLRWEWVAWRLNGSYISPLLLGVKIPAIARR